MMHFPFTSLRVIPFSYFTGIENMALDLFYAEQVAENEIPVLRFYGWEPYCLSLGHHQDFSNINIDQIKKDKIGLVKRPTGGSAILHAQELTYSFIIPKSTLGHHEMYRIFHEMLAQVLQKAGFQVQLSYSEPQGSYLNQGNQTFACFNRAAKSEIQLNGKKVVGSAQKVYKKSILQHGSILLGKEQQNIVEYLTLTEEEKTKQTRILEKKATNLPTDDPTKSKMEIAALLTKQFAETFNIRVHYKYPNSLELKEAQRFRSAVDVTTLIEDKLL